MDFASDEEQLQKLRQLAQSLEKSINPASVGGGHFALPTASSATPITSPTKVRIGSPVEHASTHHSRNNKSNGSGSNRFSTAMKQLNTNMILMRDAEDDTVHERLYQQSKVTKKKNDEARAREEARQLRKKSALIDCTERVRDLYINAESRRQMKNERILQEDRKAESDSNKVIIAPGSKILAKKRRVKDLRDLFMRHASANKDQSLPEEVRQAGKMSYVALQAALSETGFIKGGGGDDDIRFCDKLWAQMLQAQHRENPNASTTYINFPWFASVILNTVLSDDQPQVSNSKRQDIISRQLADPNFNRRVREFPEQEYGDKSCTFNPSINENSRKMLRTQDAVPRYLRLSANHSVREARLEETRKSLARRELQSCTFKPSLNKASLAMKRSHSLTVDSRRNRDKGEKPRVTTLEEMELQQCTFEPKLNTNYKRQKDKPLPSGYFETIKRLRESRTDTRNFEEKLRSSSAGYSQRHARTTVVKPFNLQLEKRHQKAKPLMYLDVQLPNGKKGRIGIHEGDTATALVTQFAATYQLDMNMQAKLLKVLEKNIQETIPELQAAQEESRKVVASEFARSAAKLARYSEEPVHELPVVSPVPKDAAREVEGWTGDLNNYLNEVPDTDTLTATATATATTRHRDPNELSHAPDIHFEDEQNFLNPTVEQGMQHTEAYSENLIHSLAEDADDSRLACIQEIQDKIALMEQQYL